MKGNWKYPEDNNELVALIRPEMQRLAALDAQGRAPSRVIWDVRRDRALPCANYILTRFRCGWPALVETCGITPSRTYRRADGTRGGGGTVPLGLADEIERGLAEGRIQHASGMDRFHAVLHALPTPSRVEQVLGWTIAGQPCVIERTYWLLR